MGSGRPMELVGLCLSWMAVEVNGDFGVDLD